MSLSAPFQDRLLAAVPSMRAYARMLCRNMDQADDLVQETLMLAWEHREKLRDLDKLKPWLLAILRNTYFVNWRRSKRELPDPDGKETSRIAVAPNQIVETVLCDVITALDQLVPDQREALVLIYVQQLSYEEAAVVAECPIGTLKSRLNRGREKLIALLRLDENEEICADALMSAVIAAPHNESSSLES
jgi:RNA polymerase sigma-70 factor, ECF subfamily